MLMDDDFESVLGDVEMRLKCRCKGHGILSFGVARCDSGSLEGLPTNNASPIQLHRAKVEGLNFNYRSSYRHLLNK
jgi:hypothetical protein